MKVLIVGQGLAGMALSWYLMPHCEVCVMDDPGLASSTGVATGMYNPIVFRYVRKSWIIDDLLPSMHEFYESIQLAIDKQVKNQVNFFKKIPNNQYEDTWNRMAEVGGFSNYIRKTCNALGEVLQAGIVDCRKLQEGFRDYLEGKSLFLSERFEIEKFTIQPVYEGKAYDKIIFCEGPFAANNPLFSWLPFNLCKGEWIIIQTKNMLQEFILNNVINIIPLGSNRYKLSSTYSWKELSWSPTESAAKELLAKFQEVYPDVSFKVVGHEAGIRPTVADRRPYLGWHPVHKNIGIFNGLGSKGVMLAPYFAKHFTEHILSGTPLMEEVDIKRHYKRFEKLNPA